MENLEAYLAEQPFFQDLDARYLEVLSGCASNARFDPGAYIFREGDPADRFYLIRHGSVSLEIHAPTGAIAVETTGPGDVLGFSWLFPPLRARFDARVLELVRAIAFDGACLRAKCDQDPGLGYELMKRFGQVLLERLQGTRLQLLDVYGNVGGR